MVAINNPNRTTMSPLMIDFEDTLVRCFCQNGKSKVTQDKRTDGYFCELRERIIKAKALKYHQKPKP
jgi:hypothetical protein